MMTPRHLALCGDTLVRIEWLVNISDTSKLAGTANGGVTGGQPLRPVFLSGQEVEEGDGAPGAGETAAARSGQQIEPSVLPSANQSSLFNLGQDDSSSTPMRSVTGCAALGGSQGKCTTRPILQLYNKP